MAGFSSWSNPNPSDNTAAALQSQYHLQQFNMAPLFAAIMENNRRKQEQEQKQYEAALQGITSAVGGIQQGQDSKLMSEYMQNTLQGQTQQNADAAQAALQKMSPEFRIKAIDWTDQQTQQGWKQNRQEAEDQINNRYKNALTNEVGVTTLNNYNNQGSQALQAMREQRIAFNQKLKSFGFDESHLFNDNTQFRGFYDSNRNWHNDPNGNYMRIKTTDKPATDPALPLDQFQALQGEARSLRTVGTPTGQNTTYTPGQGSPRMEGKWETKSGLPMFTIEQALNGQAPYAVGAVNPKDPRYGQSGTFTTADGKKVPMVLGDVGPGVHTIDVASSNAANARSTPSPIAQGQFSGGKGPVLVSSPAEASSLKPGTFYQTPDGRIYQR